MMLACTPTPVTATTASGAGFAPTRAATLSIERTGGDEDAAPDRFRYGGEIKLGEPGVAAAGKVFVVSRRGAEGAESRGLHFCVCSGLPSLGKAFLAEVTESRRERRGFRRRTGGRRCAGRDTPRGSEVLGAGDPTIPAGTRGEQGYVGSHDNSITPGARGALRAWSIAGALPRPRALRARKLFRETASQPRGGDNATTSARKLCASVPPRETRVFQTIAQPIRVRGITPP